jgi:hypothetical protein
MEVQTATLGTNIPSSLKHFRMKLRSNTGSWLGDAGQRSMVIK